MRVVGEPDVGSPACSCNISRPEASVLPDLAVRCSCTVDRANLLCLRHTREWLERVLVLPAAALSSNCLQPLTCTTLELLCCAMHWLACRRRNHDCPLWAECASVVLADILRSVLPCISKCAIMQGILGNVQQLLHIICLAVPLPDVVTSHAI